MHDLLDWMIYLETRNTALTHRYLCIALLSRMNKSFSNYIPLYIVNAGGGSASRYILLSSRIPE